MKHVFVADDDVEVTRRIADGLRGAGYRVTAVNSGLEALCCLQEQRFDLVLLDIGMDDLDGLEICRRVRDQVACPIIFLTARTGTEDTLNGFAARADDYLKKPFAVEELIARIEAHLRRGEREAQQGKPQEVLSLGGVTLELGARRVLRGGREIRLSDREFELLAALMRNAGRPMSRQELFQTVWKTEYGDISTVAFNIRNLRAKLDPEHRLIHTVWGSGYRFDPPKEG